MSLPKGIHIGTSGWNYDGWKGGYKDEVLDEYARDCLNTRKSRRSVFCYFDNDEKTNAPSDAKRLIDHLRKIE